MSERRRALATPFGSTRLPPDGLGLGLRLVLGIDHAPMGPGMPICALEKVPVGTRLGATVEVVWDSDNNGWRNCVMAVALVDNVGDVR